MRELKDLEVECTGIPGLLVLSLPVHRDDRGWFKENWQRSKMVAQGLPDFRPVQNNVSFNAARGTTRGLHAEPWDKYVSVLSGEIFGAWVDLRPGPGFGTVHTQRVGPEQALFVPRGVANGFQTLTEDTVYSYLVTEHWSESARAHYSYVNLADPTLAIDWPIELDQAIVSTADRNHPGLSEARPVAPKQIAVLGGSGQLGRALADVAIKDPRIHILTRADVDLAQPGQLRSLDLSGYSHVINAAAMTAVDRAETASGRREAWQVNAVAVQQLTDLCADHQVPLVHVSTDYVFDGEQENVGEEHPISPLGVYGQSKAAGEQAVLSSAANYVVRTSWVVGEGKNFVATMRDLAARGVDPQVVDDQWGRLTFASELAAGILHVINEGCPPGVYHLQGNGEPTSWFALAQKIFGLAGHDPQRVQPISTEDYAAKHGSMAPRPKNSTLNMDKLRQTGFSNESSDQLLEKYLSAAREPSY